MKKKTILIITPRLNIGGEELSSISIAEELLKRGHTLYYMSAHGPLEQELLAKHISFVPAKTEAKSPAGFVKGIRDIRSFITNNSIDIIHCSDPDTTIMSSIARLFVKEKPHIIWHDRRTRYYPLTARLMNILADFVITNSRFEQTKLIKNGLRASKVRTIHNGLNIPFPKEVKNTSAEKTVIAAIGRLVSIKGHRYFIKAASLIKKTHATVSFFIAGDGPLHTSLEQLSDEQNLAKDIVFTGFRRDLKHLYESLDILVNPSLYESFGNTCLEAMAFGKPVVATRVGGVPEVVLDGKTGILVSPGDPEALRDAICYLVEHPDIARQMGREGRKRAQNYFTYERAGNEIEELYEKVCDENIS